MIEWLFACLLGAWIAAASPPAAAPSPAVAALPPPLPALRSDLDRIAFAVEGVESRHGRDLLMWQPNLRGPQGPMQVTHAAAIDVGGGNRFDMAENRQVGRAYLANLYRRYGNWADAVAAYNWGPGKFDRWVAAGRPIGQLSAPVRAYVERIMREFVAGPSIAVAVPAIAAPAPAAPVVQPPPEIKDPALHKRYQRNADAIKLLRDFVGGDDSAANAVRAEMHTASARRGYEEFGRLRPADPRAPSIATLRDIARILLGKLEAENAAIVLVDERRHGKLR